MTRLGAHRLAAQACGDPSASRTAGTSCRGVDQPRGKARALRGRRRDHRRVSRCAAKSSRTRPISRSPQPCSGLGAFDEHDPKSLYMLGMHGSAYANYAVQECDCLIAVGARFDDRVTGNLATFAPKAKIIHIDIDPSSIGKNVDVDVTVVGDAAVSLELMVPHLEHRDRARMVHSDQRLEEALSLQVFRGHEEHQAAIRDRRTASPDQWRSDHHHRRGPASDVGGAVLPLALPPPDDHQRRPGHDGLRPAQRHGRAARLPGQDRHRHRRRRQLLHDAASSCRRSPNTTSP